MESNRKRKDMKEKEIGIEKRGKRRINIGGTRVHENVIHVEQERDRKGKKVRGENDFLTGSTSCRLFSSGIPTIGEDC